MTLITIFIWMIITCSSVSLGQVVLTQSGDQTVQAGKTVSITCKHDPAIDCYDTATKKKDCVSCHHDFNHQLHLDDHHLQLRLFRAGCVDSVWRSDSAA
ncbi:hypothetical protein SRHO_G00009090 [Serrasalmus rhombeus]